MPVADRMYARALYEAAREHGRVAVVHEQLGELAAAIASMPELRAVLGNPELDSHEKASLLEAILGGADELVRNCALLAAEKGRAAELPQICAELDELVAGDEGRLSVELTTAVELSDDEARDVVARIESASGRQVEATRKVDPSLIGGLVLQAGSFRADGSVRGRLEGLRHALATTRS
jgi:F-type H+-transporting ATPase subunit delta